MNNKTTSEQIKVRACSIVCTAHPEWGTWGVMEDMGPYFEILNSSNGGSRVLFKDEADSHWHVVGKETPEQLVASIRPGDRVTIRVPAGISYRNGQEWSERTGKAVICSGTHVALNMGGRFGTPGVATPENIVSVRRAAK